MNLILFAPEETSRPLPRDDDRARHILEVLRRRPGDSFDAGLIDGPRGKATLKAVDDGSLTLSFAWDVEPPALEPITLVLGMPRPQTGRKLLEEATALGVAAMHFVVTERGEASYRQSRLWTSGEWRRHLIAGAEQAFTTRLPAVTFDGSLAVAVASLQHDTCRLVLDNYESPRRLGEASIHPPVLLALGPEPGWSAAERDLLRSHGFEFVHLGERVLRLETACAAAVSLVRSRLGSM